MLCQPTRPKKRMITPLPPYSPLPSFRETQRGTDSEIERKHRGLTRSKRSNKRYKPPAPLPPQRPPRPRVPLPGACSKRALSGGEGARWVRKMGGRGMCAACGVRGGRGLRGRLLWYSCSEEVCVEIKRRRESVKETTTTTTPQPPSPSQTREEGRMHIHVCMEIEGESDLVLTDPIPHQRPDLHPFPPHVHPLVAHEETFFHFTPLVPIHRTPIRFSFWCPTVGGGVYCHGVVIVTGS